MTVPNVLWWRVQEDGAVHAFSRWQIGHGHGVLTTLCQKDVFAFAVDREDSGPRCLACRLLVDGSRGDSDR